MAEDPRVSEVVKQLDQACREIGFFYVVCYDLCIFIFIPSMQFPMIEEC